MQCPPSDTLVFSVEVRRLGMLVHQQTVCESDLRELLLSLASIFPPSRFSLSFKSVEPATLVNDTSAVANQRFDLFVVKNLLSNK